jgi:hypothetical protein
MSNDLRIDIAFQYQGRDFKAYTIIKEPNLTADHVDHIMAEIGCAVRRSCVNHGIISDYSFLDEDLDLNLVHEEQNSVSTSSDLEKSNVTGDPH